MQYINGSYTTYVNTKRKRSGHLLQGRYKAIIVDVDTYLLELSRYIHLNPVRAKMVKKPKEDITISNKETHWGDKQSNRRSVWRNNIFGSIQAVSTIHKRAGRQQEIKKGNTRDRNGDVQCQGLTPYPFQHIIKTEKTL